MKLKKVLVIILVFIVFININPVKVHSFSNSYEMYLKNNELICSISNFQISRIIWKARRIEVIKKAINQLQNSKLINKIHIKSYGIKKILEKNEIAKNAGRSITIEDLNKKIIIDNSQIANTENNSQVIQKQISKNNIENNKIQNISQASNLKSIENKPQNLTIATQVKPVEQNITNIKENKTENTTEQNAQKVEENKQQTSNTNNSTQKPVENNTTNTANKSVEKKPETPAIKKIQAPNGAKVGVDVSKFQGTIDWAKVKESGIEFAMIKCGSRGYTQGTLNEDPNFKKNVTGAASVGIKVGVYFYSSALNEEEAIEEANYVIGKINNYGLRSKITYPIAFDFENDFAETRNYNLTQEEGTNICKAFCNQIRNSGFKTMIYSHHYFLQTRLNMNNLQEYDTWMAQYLAKPTYPYKYTIWQYTSSGSVSGINGNVDLNYCYKNY